MTRRQRMTGPVLRTPRLELTPFAPEDAGPLHALFTHPEVRRFLLDDEVVPLAWVEAEIEASRASFREHGYGLWTVSSDGALAGFAGYREFHQPPVLELLYGLHPDFQGRGLATEAAWAVVRHGFDALGFDRVLASTDAPNTASIGVMERLGMRFRKRATTGGMDTIHYGIERQAWRG